MRDPSETAPTPLPETDFLVEVDGEVRTPQDLMAPGRPYTTHAAEGDLHHTHYPTTRQDQPPVASAHTAEVEAEVPVVEQDDLFTPSVASQVVAKAHETLGSTRRPSTDRAGITAVYAANLAAKDAPPPRSKRRPLLTPPERTSYGRRPTGSA